MKINLLKVVFPLQPLTFGLIVYPIPIRKKVSFKYKSTCEKTVSLHRCSLEVAHPDRVMDSRLFVKVPLKKLIGEVYWAGILSKKRESKCSWGLCSDHKNRFVTRAAVDKWTRDFLIKSVFNQRKFCGISLHLQTGALWLEIEKFEHFWRKNLEE